MAGYVYPVFSQEAPLKEFAEPSRQRKYCLYPSTLRMINVSQNPEYNQLIADVEKLLLYQYDSNPTKNAEFKTMMNAYEGLGFEDYISMYGGDQNLSIKGKNDAMIGSFGADDVYIIFYLKGNLALQKIPKLVNVLQEEILSDNVLLDFITSTSGNKRD